MPGFTMVNDGAEVFVHSPFSYQDEAGNEVDRNEMSSVFHLTLQDGTNRIKVFLTADAPYEVLEDIVKATEKAGNKDRLEWDLMKIPHHCRYLSLSPDKGNNMTEPTDKVARLYEYYSRQRAILVSPSDVIPSSDEIQPPHKQAAAYYRKVAANNNGQFRATMEHPTKDDPKPLKMEVRGRGVGATVVAAGYTRHTGRRRATSESPPRAGMRIG